MAASACSMGPCSPNPLVSLALGAESERRLHMSCSQGCSLLFHYPTCWRNYKEGLRALEGTEVEDVVLRGKVRTRGTRSRVGNWEMQGRGGGALRHGGGGCAGIVLQAELLGRHCAANRPRNTGLLLLRCKGWGCTSMGSSKALMDGNQPKDMTIPGMLGSCPLALADIQQLKTNKRACTCPHLHTCARIIWSTCARTCLCPCRRR